MAAIKTYIVVSANGDVRLAKKPRLALDQVAIPLVIHMPDGWGRFVRDQIDVHMPAVPTFEPVGDPIFADSADAPAHGIERPVS